MINALNALGMPNSEENPLPPNPEFAEKVAQWTKQTGAAPEYGALYRTLQHQEKPGPEVARLLAGAEIGNLTLNSDSPTDRWLGALATLLFGDRGPKFEER